MSRTDKDRPYWVKTFQDGFIIDHDHRHGECTEETLEYARGVHGRSWCRNSRHWRACKKRVEQVFYCTKRDPYTYSHHAFDWRSSTMRYRVGQECWIERCRCDVRRGYRHLNRLVCPAWGRVQCEGHREILRDDSIPCVCDGYPARPTCDAEPKSMARPRYYGGGVPTAFVRMVYHAPERGRERGLRDMAREYNAYGDIEDDDFFSRQGRGSARWAWW